MIGIVICLIFICLLEFWLILALHFQNKELDESLKIAIGKGKEVIQDKYIYKNCFQRLMKLFNKK